VAGQSFVSDPPDRDDPARMHWQDIVTHDLLGALYKSEFLRSGEGGSDSDHHYRLSLKALPRKGLDVSWSRQLNHTVRSCTGYALWCKQRGDIGSAEHWYGRAVEVAEEFAHEQFPDVGLAYLRRDIFWESISLDPAERIQGIAAGLALLPPSRVRTTLEARLRRLQREVSVPDAKDP